MSLGTACTNYIFDSRWKTLQTEELTWGWVSQKWEKVQANNEKRSGQRQRGSLFTYFIQGIISAHRCYTLVMQCAKGVPELSRKENVVSRVSANVRRKQHRHTNVMVQQLHPGLEPARVFDASGSCKAASNCLCSIRCPLPTDLPHEAKRRVWMLSVSVSLLWLPWDAVNFLSKEKVWSCLLAVIFLHSPSSGFCQHCKFPFHNQHSSSKMDKGIQN